MKLRNPALCIRFDLPLTVPFHNFVDAATPAEITVMETPST